MSTSLSIARSVLDRVHQHAKAGYPREVCGLLLSRGVNGSQLIEQAVVVPNAAEPAQQHDRYAIDPTLLLHWERLASRGGLRVAGVYLSHPNAPARPSVLDLEAAWPGYAYLIVSVARGIPVTTAAWAIDTSSREFNELRFDIHLDEPEWVI